MEEKINLGTYYSDPSVLGGADGLMSDDGPINPIGLEDLEEKIQELDITPSEKKVKNPSLNTRTNIDNLQIEYNEVERIIIGYIQTNISNLRRLELHKERLLEQKAEIGINESNREALEAEFDRQIRETESEIRKLVSPSTEENIRIRNEKDELYRLATEKIQKLEALISELEARNRKLNFQYSEMVYEGIKDYTLWNKKKNEIDENEYRIRQMKELIGKYENLKEELRKTEKVIDLSKFEEKEPKKEKTEEEKYITMEYPNDLSTNDLWDGRDHEIIPGKLELFVINGVEYYLMSYWDVTYGCECHTYLTVVDGQIVKIPVSNYALMAELVSGLERIEVDINILPQHIALGETLDVTILISVIQGKEPVVTPPGGTTVTPPGGTTVTPPGGTTVTPPGGTIVTPPGGTTVTPPGGTPVPPPGGTPVPPPEEPTEEENITLSEILYKIQGEEEFTTKQASRYMASKVKIFSKIQKDQRGNTYKVVSIPRRIFGIIPKTFLKIKGMFLKEDTRDLFEEIEERIENLTDKELEILLPEYKGNLGQGFKTIPLINSLLLARIQKYIMEKVMYIRADMFNLMMEIDYYGRIAMELDEKLANMDKEDNEYDETVKTANEAFAKTSEKIRQYRKLNVEANNLLNGSGLHSFEEEMNAINSKMNYKGAAFAKFNDYDPELSRQLGEYDHKMQFSNNPREVVYAYFDNRDLYLENTEEKRSLLNLFSKVSTGALDYRPLPEVLYYGKDPLISDLITTILCVTSLMNLVQSIQANIKNNQIIQQHNQAIAQNNAVGQQHQAFKQNIEGSGSTIEQGFVDQIHRTPGAAENLAERSVNTAHGHHLSGSSYRTADTLHHTETANLTTNNIQEMTNLSHQVQTGAITEAQYIRELQQLLNKNQSFANNYYNNYGQSLHSNVVNNPNFDFTAIINEINHVAANPTAASDFSKFVADVFENAHTLPDFTNLGFIQGLVDAPMGAGLAALAAVGSKAAQEEMTSDKRDASWENDSKFIELVEILRSGRRFTKEDLDRNYENNVSRSR